MDDSRNYLGAKFEVWPGQQTWFWYVVDPEHDAGSVGNAPSEAAAEREARALIERIAATSVSFARAHWSATLSKLEHHLASIAPAAA